MSKKILKLGCDQCFKKFGTNKGLSLHKTRMNHWFKPAPVIEKEHVCYRDLVKNSYTSWGTEMPKKEKDRNIQRDQLMLGALFEIIDLMHKLIEEVKRPR